MWEALASSCRHAAHGILNRCVSHGAAPASQAQTQPQQHASGVGGVSQLLQSWDGLIWQAQSADGEVTSLDRLLQQCSIRGAVEHSLVLCLHCSPVNFLPQQLAGGMIPQASSCRQAQMDVAKQQQVRGLGCTCSSCKLVVQDHHDLLPD